MFLTRTDAISPVFQCYDRSGQLLKLLHFPHPVALGFSHRSFGTKTRTNSIPTKQETGNERRSLFKSDGAVQVP